MTWRAISARHYGMDDRGICIIMVDEKMDEAQLQAGGISTTCTRPTSVIEPSQRVYTTLQPEGKPQCHAPISVRVLVLNAPTTRTW